MKTFLSTSSVLSIAIMFFCSCSKQENPEAQNTNSKDEPKSAAAKEEKAAQKQVTEKSAPEEITPVETTTAKEETGSEPNEPNPTEAIITPPAVLAFSKEIQENGISELFQKLEAQGEIGNEDMEESFNALNDLNDKLKILKTDGLPADLKDGVEQLRAGIAEMVIHIEEIPIPADIWSGGEEAIGAWFIEKSAEDPDFGEEFGESMRDWAATMEELGKEMEDTGNNIGEIFAKYGMEDPAQE